MLIYLGIACGCFHTTPTDLSSVYKDHRAQKARDIFHVAFTEDLEILVINS